MLVVTGRDSLLFYLQRDGVLRTVFNYCRRLTDYLLTLRVTFSIGRGVAISSLPTYLCAAGWRYCLLMKEAPAGALPRADTIFNSGCSLP